MNIASELKRTTLSGLEAVINRYLHLDPATIERLAGLEGKAIEIRLHSPDLRCFVLPGPAGIRLSASLDRTPDTTLSGTPFGLLRSGLTSDHRRVLFSGDLRIDGDTETGRQFKRILDGLDIDWEEQLSAVTGDVAAHHLGNLARGFGAWSARAGNILLDDIGDYLHEEARLLPLRDEVEEFVTAVDVLQADADRLEQRVLRLDKLAQDPAPGRTP